MNVLDAYVTFFGRSVLRSVKEAMAFEWQDVSRGCGFCERRDHLLHGPRGWKHALEIGTPCGLKVRVDAASYTSVQ
jgi:hypothetical protein